MRDGYSVCVGEVKRSVGERLEDGWWVFISSKLDAGKPVQLHLDLPYKY